MQKINYSLTATLLITASFAWAQPSGLTVQEARAIQGRLAVAELEAKVREAQNRGNGSGPGGTTPVPVPMTAGAPVMGAVKGEEIQFVGHYGIEDDLKADFLLNGTLVTFSLNGESEIGGWKLTSLTPRQARICRVGSAKAGACKTVLLSIDKQVAPADSGQTSSMPVTPLPSTIAAAK